MYTKIGFLVHAVVIGVLLAGCAYQRKVTLPPVGLPEEVFSIPVSNDYGEARVGVFPFGDPSYARGKGRLATRFMCQELERMGVFAEVVPEPEISDMTIGNLIDVARSKGYDLIITGELLHHFEGSLLEPSSVTEEVRIFKVGGGEEPVTLWYARATETASPARSTDYIVAQGKGAPAPSTEVLMRRNAEKFCNMILSLPPRPGQNPPGAVQERTPGKEKKKGD